jgi:hypothetical protein
MKLRVLLVAAVGASLALAVGVGRGGAHVNLPWQTGIRAVGNLLTPNNSPFYAGPGPLPPPFKSVSAPLYLVTYPLASTADAAAPFNCYTEGFFTPGLPYNCDHAQIPGIKGHDHLVGDPGSKTPDGDYNVQWHVLITFFTAKGIQDGAMNTRILTLQALKAAQAAGDVTPVVDSGIYFDCSAVSAAVYQNGTPLSFTP